MIGLSVVALLVVRPAFPWLWVSTLNRFSLLCTPSSAKLVIIQCCKLIVICRLSLFVVINIHLYQ